MSEHLNLDFVEIGCSIGNDISEKERQILFVEKALKKLTSLKSEDLAPYVTAKYNIITMEQEFSIKLPYCATTQFQNK